MCGGFTLHVIALSYHSGADKQAPDSVLLGKAGI